MHNVARSRAPQFLKFLIFHELPYLLYLSHSLPCSYLEFVHNLTLINTEKVTNSTIPLNGQCLFSLWLVQLLPAFFFFYFIRISITWTCCFYKFIRYLLHILSYSTLISRSLFPRTLFYKNSLLYERILIYKYPLPLDFCHTHILQNFIFFEPNKLPFPITSLSNDPLKDDLSTT